MFHVDLRTFLIIKRDGLISSYSAIIASWGVSWDFRDYQGVSGAFQGVPACFRSVPGDIEGFIGHYRGIQRYTKEFTGSPSAQLSGVLKGVSGTFH